MNKTSIKILQKLVNEGIFEDPADATDLIINLLRTPDILSLYLKEAIPGSVLLRSKIGNDKDISIEKKPFVSNDNTSDKNSIDENIDSIHVSTALTKIQSLDLTI
jgi:hypothetical protein